MFSRDKVSRLQFFTVGRKIWKLKKHPGRLRSFATGGNNPQNLVLFWVLSSDQIVFLFEWSPKSFLRTFPFSQLSHTDFELWTISADIVAWDKVCIRHTSHSHLPLHLVLSLIKFYTETEDTTVCVVSWFFSFWVKFSWKTCKSFFNWLSSWQDLF